MIAKRTATATFGPFSPFENSGVIVVKANGGQVEIQYMIAESPEEFITHRVITEDGANEIHVRRSVVRVVPSGGAEYSFEPQVESA